MANKNQVKPQEKKLFLVWQDGDEEKFHNQYETLEDAVSSEGDGCEVYVAEPKYLGKFKRTAEIVKIKAKKKRKK